MGNLGATVSTPDTNELHAESREDHEPIHGVLALEEGEKKLMIWGRPRTPLTFFTVGTTFHIL